METETLNRKPDFSLAIHFLYQCHMGFATAPPFQRLQAVLSPLVLMVEMNMITEYDQFFCPIVTKIHIRPIFQETHILQTFRHTNQENITFVRKINFVVSVSGTHSHEIW